VVKGERQPDKVATPLKQERPESPQEDLSHYLTPCEDPHEVDIMGKYYGENWKVWDSVCGNYRIRCFETVMGVPVEMVDGKHYRLLIKTIFQDKVFWEIFPGKHRFRKLNAAIKAMLKHKRERHVRTETA
jgi:hypothetical protein